MILLAESDLFVFTHLDTQYIHRTACSAASFGTLAVGRYRTVPFFFPIILRLFCLQ